MTFFKTIKIQSKGFTLVEVIVTIIAAGILGAIFINFMGTALQSSWNAVEITRDEAETEKLMEQIIGEYVAGINKTDDPNPTLDNIVANYNGQTFNGVSVTTEYITFDSSGNEQSGGTDYLKIVLQASGSGAPAISGRYSITTILAKNREPDDLFFVLF